MGIEDSQLECVARSIVSCPHISIIRVLVSSVQTPRRAKTPLEGWPCDVGEHTPQPSQTARRGVLVRITRASHALQSTHRERNVV